MVLYICVYLFLNYAVWLRCVAAVFWMLAFDGKRCREGRDIMQKCLFMTYFTVNKAFGSESNWM